MKRKHKDVDPLDIDQGDEHLEADNEKDAIEVADELALKMEVADDSTDVQVKAESRPSTLSEIEFKQGTQLTPEIIQLIHSSASSMIKRNSKKSRKDDGKREILKKSIPYLLNSYGATMSPTDRLVLETLTMYSDRKIGLDLETMPLFGPKNFELLTNSVKKHGQNTNPNPLFVHSSRANTILVNCLDDKKAYHTCLHYSETKFGETDSSYDLEFILSLLCHILSETNICDGTKVISHGWIYFIMKGLSLENEKLRAMAFLAYQRLLTNFEQAKTRRNQDIKIWLHFLNAIRRGIQMMGTPKISHLLATWIIAIWKIIKEPTNPMFLCAVNCLFAKPIIEMTILPDFVPFYNDANDKESRTWLLSVLYCGLRTPEDWKIIQKSPFIKFLCSSFQLEKVKTQRTIIAILGHGTSIPEVVDEFIDKYSILVWLGNIKVTSRNLKEEIEDFFYLLRLRSSLNVSAGTRTYNSNVVRLRETLFEFVTKKQNWTKSASNYEKSCKVYTSSESTFLTELDSTEQNDE